MSDHVSPCASHVEFSKAVWRVIGIIIVVGGAGLAYSIDRARSAESIATIARDEARKTEVLGNDVAHMAEDLKEMKAALSSMTRIEVTLATVAGDIKAMETRMDGWDSRSQE